MSRLIDADAIPYTMLYKENWLKGTGVEKPGVWKDTIDAMPTIEPERKKGKWLGYNADKPGWLRTDGTPIFLICTECNGTVINNGSAHWNYCPNCGADMKGELE